ncbi:MAG: hypothetical protein IT285_08355 [Bdellovibrionales bacterium]|nr:hypothetical protein [Bdellovibrionales bacterium]
MKSLKSKLLSFLREEEGQSTTEYILILAVVMVIAMKFKSGISDQLGRATEKIGEKIGNTVDDI